MKLASSLTFAIGKQVMMLVYSLVVFYYPLAGAAMTVWLFYMMIELLFGGIKIGIEEKKVK